MKQGEETDKHLEKGIGEPSRHDSSATSGAAGPTESSDFLEQRRVALGAALKQATSQEHQKKQTEYTTNTAQAITLASEFFSAVLVGAALGFGLDKIAGTSPFGLIVLLILGFAAGVLNVLRSLNHKAL